MPYPTPTSPTINDLQYQSFSAVTAFSFNPQILDGTITSEKITLDLVGYSASLPVEDFSITSESISVVPQPTGPTLISLLVGVSDTTITSEVVTPDFVGFSRQLLISDSTVTSENVSAVQA